MKFVHIADMHFDMPFTLLNQKGFAEARRLDQRNAFQKMIKYIKENQIDCLFIAGDLYEHSYVRRSTIDFINDCFKEIPHTKVYIAPGNHDPYLTNSYYHQYSWNENVHIFTEVEKIQYNEGINLYGYGFTNFYSPKVNLPKEIDFHKINIFIMHADVNGNGQNGEYNPILETELKNANFDYMALGHVHKSNFKEKKKIVYPGSTIAGGFDELGMHGMIVGEIHEHTKEIKLQFVFLDEKEFVEQELDISNITSTEELLERLNQLTLHKNKYYKIILVGNRQFEIDTSIIFKNIIHENIIKIKDKSKVEFNLEKIAQETSLRGIFVNELLKKMNEDNKEQILESIFMGLNLM